MKDDKYRDCYIGRVPIQLVTANVIRFHAVIVFGNEMLSLSLKLELMYKNP